MFFINTLIEEEITKRVKKSYTGTKAFEELDCIFNVEKSAQRTDKFVPVCTLDFLKSLAYELTIRAISFTWNVRGTNNSRTVGNNKFQKHLVVMNIDFPGSVVYDENGEEIGRFNLLMWNAADGSNRLVIAVGFQVKACDNGCVWDDIYSESTKHIFIDAKAIIKRSTKAIVEFIDNFQMVGAQYQRDIVTMSTTRLSEDQQRRFALEAFDLKVQENQNIRNLDSTEGEKYFEVDYKAILGPTRHEHARPTLWNVFQTVQENLRGNLDPNKTRNLVDITYKTLKREINEDGSLGKLVTRNSRLRAATKRVDKYKTFNEDLTKLAMSYLPKEEA